MFYPPIARGMRVLDRSFFQKTVALKAARIFDNKNISNIRSQLRSSKDALQQDRLGDVYSDPDPDHAKIGRKCILLRPEIREEHREMNGSAPTANNNLKLHWKESPTKPWPHSPVLTELVQQGLISVIPYKLNLDYNYWTYHDIISAILPLEAQDEIPSGFSQVGHVAHLNLREDYLPYKHLIAGILLDKNPNVRTVINKTDDVGHENEFRTFQYEVLAGPDDMNVTVSEAHCTFSFDYSKVYWNTRLQTEHSRLVSLFREGEAVCDVMAGIGPFAVPAGKKNVFVWANDLNPDSYASLQDAISRNKVGDFVTGFNVDGRDLIRSATAQLLDSERVVEIKKKASRKDPNVRPEVLKTLHQPKTFQHFVLNLPASAPTFLPSFIGLYPPGLRSKLPESARMPIVHVYCFGIKDELSSAAQAVTETEGAAYDICVEITRQLHYQMRPGSVDVDGGVEVFDVRDVAPKKRMFCASFRLPEEVAFRAQAEQ